MDSTTELAYKKEERLSKNTCCYKYKNQQRNTRFKGYRWEITWWKKSYAKVDWIYFENNKDVKIGFTLGDGSYDSNKNF